jgi:CYTH domain-containing protein
MSLAHQRKLRDSREIERKFLVRAQYAVRADSSARIRQGYLVTTPTGEEVRLRAWDEQRYSLTYKHGSGVVRVEREIEITRTQFAELWPATEGKRLNKVRHSVPLEKHVAAVDVYLGALKGLRTVEVEFRTLEECEKFVAPSWFGREITTALEYKLRVLVVAGLPAAHAVPAPSDLRGTRELPA